MLGGALGLELRKNSIEHIRHRVNMSFDVEFEKIPKLRWYPWVGCDFRCGSDVMVVCESHYSSRSTMQEIESELEVFCDDRMATREIVHESLIEHQYSNPTYTNVEKVLVGDSLWRGTDEVDRWGRLWQQMAFMNVIQRPMKFLRGEYNERPRFEDYQDGARALLSVIQILKPKMCFIGASAVAGYLMMLASEAGIVVEDKKESRVGRCRARSFSFRFDGHQTAVRVTRQPGSYYSWSKWRDFVFCGFGDLQQRLANALSSGLPE